MSLYGLARSALVVQGIASFAAWAGGTPAGRVQISVGKHWRFHWVEETRAWA